MLDIVLALKDVFAQQHFDMVTDTGNYLVEPHASHTEQATRTVLAIDPSSLSVSAKPTSSGMRLNPRTNSLRAKRKRSQARVKKMKRADPCDTTRCIFKPNDHDPSPFTSGSVVKNSMALRRCLGDCSSHLDHSRPHQGIQLEPRAHRAKNDETSD